MNCCQCQGIEKEFGKKYVSKELKKYHKKGVSKTTRMLISALRQEEVKEKTLLDIGGGIGSIQHELFKHGLKRATAVDASSAYLEAAKQEANAQGFLEMIEFHHGDFVDLAAEIKPTDIVTLDRVICCYHNMTDLVKFSTSKAEKICAMVYPVDTWWVKSMLGITNFLMWLTGSPFRIFTHPSAQVNAIMVNAGFDMHSLKKSGMWQIVVYKRKNVNN